MFSAEEIKALIQGGEGYNVEFKVRVPNKPKEITEEICAFSNAAGGTLLLGVNDKNTIVGVEIDNVKRSAIQNSLNEINPHIPCQFYSVSVDGKEVWVIEVSSGDQKPYTLSGAIYVRQGQNSQKITSVEQMRDFFQQSSRIYFDEAPCSDFTINDINELFFEEFRIISGLSPAVSREQIIRNLKLSLPSGEMKNGAVLFFGNRPEEHIDKAVIRCVAFDGIDKVTIIDDKIYGGPLYYQYKQAMQWLKGKLNVRYKIEGQGPREEIWEIPEVAFKEAIINALSHRDYYDKGARTTIELFSDRVEITNPGGLVSAISMTDFGYKSHSRNPLVFGLFERMDMVEQIGSGIIRIQELLSIHKLKAANFRTEGMFTIIFNRPKFEENETKTRVKTRVKTKEKIISLIIKNKDVTAVGLTKLTGVTLKTIEFHLRNLKQEGIIEHLGPKNGGYWIVKEVYKNK